MTNKAIPSKSDSVNPLVGQLVAVIVALVDERVRVALERPTVDIVSDITSGLPVSPAKARHLAKTGAIPATKKGRRWFFRRADLLAYLSPSTAPAASNDVAPHDPVDELADRLGLRIGGAR